MSKQYRPQSGNFEAHMPLPDAALLNALTKERLNQLVEAEFRLLNAPVLEPTAANRAGWVAFNGMNTTGRVASERIIAQADANARANIHNRQQSPAAVPKPTEVITPSTPVRPGTPVDTYNRIVASVEPKNSTAPLSVEDSMRRVMDAYGPSGELIGAYEDLSSYKPVDPTDFLTDALKEQVGYHAADLKDAKDRAISAEAADGIAHIEDFLASQSGEESLA